MHYHLNNLFIASCLVTTSFAMICCPLACDVTTGNNLTSEELNSAVFRGGPMPLKEATQLAERCSQNFPDDDKKLKTAFEKTIVRMLAYRDPYERAEAAGELGTYRKASAVDALLLATDDDSPAVRCQALRAIGWINVKNAALPVAGKLQDSNPEVRKTAAETLGRLANPIACDALIAALKDNDAAVRSSAAAALGWCRDPRAIRPLIKSLKDPSPKVRAASAGALGLIGQADPTDAEHAVSELIQALEDENATVRYLAAGALGKLGDPRAIAPLQTLRKDPERVVRNQAEAALRKLEKPKLDKIVPQEK